MTNKNGVILWLLAGAGVILLYAAYKNVQPQSLLAKYFSGATTTTPITTYGIANGVAPIPNVTLPDGKTYDTAPGGPNGYITTDPPGAASPAAPGAPLALYYDANGNPRGVVPTIYQQTPNLFISGV